MCFGLYQSAAFTVLGLSSASIVYAIPEAYNLQNKNAHAFILLFFTLMELFQMIGYIVIDDCYSSINTLIVYLSMIHVTVQPLISCLYLRATDYKPKQNEQNWRIIIKCCAFCCVSYSLRYIFPLVIKHSFLVTSFPSIFNACKDDTFCVASFSSSSSLLTGTIQDKQQQPVQQEMLHMTQTCIVSGVYHQIWYAEQVRSSFFLPGIYYHFFFCIVAPILLDWKQYGLAQSLVCLVGPMFSNLLVTNESEAASIWCAFSTLHCCFGIAKLPLLKTCGNIFPMFAIEVEENENESNGTTKQSSFGAPVAMKHKRTIVKVMQMRIAEDTKNQKEEEEEEADERQSMLKHNEEIELV